MKRKLAFFSILCLTLLSTAATTPFQATKIKGQINIDGKLDEPDWQNATTYNNFRSINNLRPDFSAKPEFRVLCDDENVYFGVTVREPDMSQLKATHSEYTSNPWADDVIELFLSPSGRFAEYYQFVFAAGGAIWYAYYEEQGNIQPDPYKPILNSKVAIGKDSWSLEVQLPLKAFYMTPQHQWKNDWLVNVATECHRKTYETISWSPVDRWFRDSKNYNKMGNLPIRTIDASIKEVTFAAKQHNADKYYGDITLTATAPAGGKYLLTVGDNAPVEKTLGGGANKISVPGSFPATGKNPTYFKLADSQGKVIAERYYPVLVTFQPLSFEFEKPFYGNCFFPGQDATNLKGYIQVRTDAKQVHFSGAGYEKDLKVKDGKAAFDFSLKNFKEKDFVVKATLGEYSNEAHIRVLPPKEKGNMLWIDHGKLFLNGKPIVVRSFYGIAGLQPGITYLCSNLMETQYKPASRKMPCQDFVSFRASVQLEDVKTTPQDKSYSVESREGIKDQKPSPEVFDWYDKRIAEVKDNDFAVYYLSDEPECRGVSPIYLKYLYDYIKEKDPYHPVFIISRSPEAYMNCCDVMAPHPYTLPQVDIHGKRSYHRSFDMVNRTCAGAKKFGLDKKILLLCNAAYGSLGDNMFADYENFDEVCANTWILFANGGMGLFPFIWFDHCTRPEESKAFDFCYRAMERLEKYITDDVEEEALSISNSNITARLTMPFGKPMLILVNTATTPEKVTFKAKELKKAKQLYSFCQDSIVKPEGDSLTLELAPLQWMILMAEKADDGLTTVAQEKANLVKIREQMAARGNLLYGKAARDVDVSASEGVCNVLREILFNGWFEGRVWLPQKYKYYPSWIQLSFTNEVPRFSKIRLVGYNCSKAKFKYWKYGEWLEITPTVTVDGYECTFDIGKTISTVKLRAEWAPQPEKLEIYEYELLK